MMIGFGVALCAGANADTVREPNGALLCKTQAELAMALRIIKARSLPDHNLQCWNVGIGAQVIRVRSAGDYALVRQHGATDQGWTSAAWLSR
jgi:predicted PhzF superfamily epimerase YddE/YHI9